MSSCCLSISASSICCISCDLLSGPGPTVAGPCPTGAPTFCAGAMCWTGTLLGEIQYTYSMSSCCLSISASSICCISCDLLSGPGPTVPRPSPTGAPTFCAGAMCWTGAGAEGTWGTGTT